MRNKSFYENEEKYEITFSPREIQCLIAAMPIYYGATVALENANSNESKMLTALNDLAHFIAFSIVKVHKTKEDQIFIFPGFQWFVIYKALVLLRLCSEKILTELVVDESSKSEIINKTNSFISEMELKIVATCDPEILRSVLSKKTKNSLQND